MQANQRPQPSNQDCKVLRIELGSGAALRLEASMVELGEKIRKSIVSAISDFDLLRAGDRVMIAVSGGKDSAILAILLHEIQRRAHFHFELQAVILDQKQPGFVVEEFKDWLQSYGINLAVIEADTYSIVKEKVESNKTYCGLCSRLRRGILYNYAHNHGYNKIALGHHRDDFNETALLNLFYSGSISAMPPKLLSDDGRNIVIRPLAYVPERELIAYARELAIPVIPCNLCGSQEKLKRKKIKAMLSDLELENPRIGSSIFAALGNIKPTQLMDKQLQDFSAF
jgi:tRNA 2-thiocytidine biosynthesis protein TtcA